MGLISARTIGRSLSRGFATSPSTEVDADNVKGDRLMKALDRNAHRTLVATAGCLLAVASAGTWGQSDQQSAGLEEVVVTATKRAESLQDVPISVGVVTGETIEKYGLMGFEDLQNAVPNLLVHETLGSYQIRIRGLGSGAAQLAFANAVGIFVDGVYCGRPRCFQEPMFDVDRIEVVRGPQGALFGKNTIAGAVNMTSARPTREFEAKLSAGTELSEGGFNVNGYLSGPLSDTVSARLAFKRDDLDGFIKNTSTGKDENAVETLLGRATLEWKPSESFSLVAKIEQASKDIDGYTPQLIGYGGYGVNYAMGEIVNGVPIPNATTPIPFSQPEALDDKTSTRSIFPEGQFDNTDSTNASLNLEWKLGEFTLNSITGYTAFDFLRRSTATAYTDLFVDTEIGEDYKQYSQEIRLTSPKGERFDFVGGVYFSKDESDIIQWSPFSLPGRTDFLTGIRRYHGELEALSAYLSGTLHLFNDRARATVGLRYGEDTVDGRSTLVNGTYDRPNNVFVRNSALPFINGIINREFIISSSRTDDYFDPSVSLQFDATDDIMLYASYAKGFKAGGFLANDGGVGNNVIAEVARTTPIGGSTSTWAQTFAGVPTISLATLASGIVLQQDNGIYDYRPEKAKSFELGAKMNFADNRVRWNVALYKTDFTDLQTSQFDGVRFLTRNAAASVSKGIESELDWKVSESFTLSFDAAYNDAYYEDYTNTFCKVIDLQGTLAVPGCVTGMGVLTGETLDRAPKFEATLSGNWESNVTDNLTLRVNAGIYRSDDYFIQGNMSPLYAQPAFTKYDLRVALADARDDKWEVALIGRNLSDELTIQHAFLVGRYSAASVSTPRYITLQGTWRF